MISWLKNLFFPKPIERTPEIVEATKPIVVDVPIVEPPVVKEEHTPVQKKPRATKPKVVNTKTKGRPKKL